MKLSIGKIIAIIVVLVILAGAGGAAGVYVYRQQQVAGWLADGNRHFEEGTYNLAKASYGLYLRNQPDDREALKRYAESCRNILEDRRFSLAQAATAMHQSLRYTDPNDPERDAMVEELIDLYQKIQAWGDLLFFVEQELVSNPESTELRLARGTALYRLGKFQDAEKEFAALCESEDAPTEAYGYLATLLYDRRLNSQAAQVLDDAIAARPGDCEILVERARFRFARGEEESALTDLDSALSGNENCVPALVEKAIILAEQRRYDEAAALAEKAIVVDPSFPKSYTVVSHVLQRTGRMEEAADLLQEMDEYVRTDRPTIMLALMEIQLALDRIEDAKATVAEYMAAYPTHLLVKDYFEGRIALIENRFEDAIETLGVVYSEQPKFAPAHFFLISAYLAAGERDQARTVLDQYMAVYPRDERAKALLAREYGRYQDPAALRDVARGKLVDPLATAEELVAAGTTVVGGTQGARGDEAATTLALELFNEAIRRDPSYPEAYRAIADFYASLDRLDDAREAIKTAHDAGIPVAATAISQANIELRAGETDAAAAIMREDLASAEGVRAVQWATFFMNRTNYDLAQEAIDTGTEGASDELARALEIEQARLLVRQGQVADGVARLDALENDEADQKKVDAVRENAARRLLQSGESEDVAQAGALVDGLLEQSPEDVALRLLKVQTLVQHTPPDYEGARTLLNEVMEGNGRSPQVLFAMSSLAMQEGKLEEALEHAKQLVVVAPAYTPGQIRLAEIHVQMGQLREAEAALETSLDTNPGIPEVIAMLVGVYMQEGQGRNAEMELRKLERIVGNDSRWASRLESLRREYQAIAGEAKESEATLRAEYEAAPDELDRAAALADNLIRQSRLPEAISLIQDWTDANPASVDGWNALARLHLMKRDEDGLWAASTALTRALVVEPENLGALRDMVDVQKRLGNYADAILLVDRYLRIRPNDAEMLYDKASFITRDRNRLSEAITYVSRAIELRDDPKYRGLRGFIYLELDDYAAALEDLEIAAQARGVSSGQLDLALAEGYLGIANYDLAHRYYDLAVEKAERGEDLSTERLNRVEGGLRTDE